MSKRETMAEENSEKEKSCHEKLISQSAFLAGWDARSNTIEELIAALEKLEAGFAGMFGNQTVSAREDFYKRGEDIVIQALAKFKKEGE